MTAEQITAELGSLFPDGGRCEELAPIEERVMRLSIHIMEAWQGLPLDLRNRIAAIETAMHGRCIGFALRAMPFYTDNDEMEDGTSPPYPCLLDDDKEVHATPDSCKTYCGKEVIGVVDIRSIMTVTCGVCLQATQDQEDKEES